MKNKRMVGMALAAVLVLSVATALGPVARDASALDLGGLLGGAVKLGGVLLVVDKFGDQINSFINKFLDQNGCPLEGKSKVVPIIRVLGGAAVGAAQVVGPPRQVDKVQGVGELQLNAGRFRGRALVPVTARKNLTSSIKGIGGVGTSAEIKFPL
jgi:hypothetical protein